MVSAKQGNNAIELVTLADGTYDDCAIQVVDMAGNFSKVLKISRFSINTQPPALPEINQPEDDVTDPSYTIFGTKETRLRCGWEQADCKHNTDTSWKYS